MKLIIDIDEEQYKEIIENDYIYSLGESDLVQLENKIYNGKPLQEEYEEIKAEILEAYPYFDSADVHWGFDICRDIVDNHIKELKGENNG